MSSPLRVYFRIGEVLVVREKFAQLVDFGIRRARISGRGKRNYAELPVGLHRMAELHRLGIREPDDRRRVETHADRKPLRQRLVRRLGRDDRRPIACSPSPPCSGRAGRNSSGFPPDRPPRRRLRPRISAPSKGSSPIRDRTQSVPWRLPDVQTNRYEEIAGRTARATRTQASNQD